MPDPPGAHRPPLEPCAPAPVADAWLGRPIDRRRNTQAAGEHGWVAADGDCMQCPYPGCCGAQVLTVVTVAAAAQAHGLALLPAIANAVYKFLTRSVKALSEARPGFYSCQ